MHCQDEFLVSTLPKPVAKTFHSESFTELVVKFSCVSRPWRTDLKSESSVFGETGSACVRIQTGAFPSLSPSLWRCRALLCSVGNFEVEGIELTSFKPGRQCYKKTNSF